MPPTDIPAYATPVYHDFARPAGSPYPVSEPRARGADGLGADTSGGGFTTFLTYAVAIGLVYAFRKPIGGWLAGFDPDSKLPRKAATGAKRAYAAARGSKPAAAVGRGVTVRIVDYNTGEPVRSISVSPGQRDAVDAAEDKVEGLGYQVKHASLDEATGVITVEARPPSRAR